jgi:hypothetical protein
MDGRTNRGKTLMTQNTDLLCDPEKLPLIDLNELDDQHHKAYLSKSLKEAVRRYAREQGVTESEATRRLLLEALKSTYVYGGYRVSARNHRGYNVIRF